MNHRRWWLLGVAIAAILLLAGRGLAASYIDFRWYAALGATSLWYAKAINLVLLKGVSWLVAAGFIFANLYAVRHSIVLLVLPRKVANVEIAQRVPGRYMVIAAALISVVLGAVLTVPAREWVTLAQLRSGRRFGETDPFLENDLGFYVHWLPFENAMFYWALVAVLAVSALVVFLYALTPSLRWEQGQLYVSRYVRRHMAVLAALGLLLLAWSYRLDSYSLLFEGSGPDGSFSFVDHRARLPAALWLSLIVVAASATVLWFGWTGQPRMAFGAVLTVLLLALAVRQLGPAFVRRYTITEDPIAREQKYEDIRAIYSRRAFAADRVTVGDPTLQLPDVASLAAAVSVWDPAVLMRSGLVTAAGERVEAGPGWSITDAGLTAAITSRPMRGPEDAGNGRDHIAVTRLLATTADGRGDPVRLADRSASAATELVLDSALVYEGAVGSRIVSDPADAVAAPELESRVSRLAHAWALQNFRLVVDDAPVVRPRIVMRRGVRERVGALAPFFRQGTTITPVVAGDSLFWTLSLYASSSAYPLSARQPGPPGGEGVAYLHLGATAIVNAHSGAVLLLPAPVLDPISDSWVRAFPSLFHRADRLHPGLAASLPPAVDGARAQALAIARYGRRGEVARNGHLPRDQGVDTTLLGGVTPLHHLGGERGSLAWSQAVLDRDDRVAGVVIAEGGVSPRTFWFPGPEPGPRWITVIAGLREASDATTARDVRLVFGRIRVLPVRDSLVFVQPAYSMRGDRSLALTRVAVARGERSLAGRTLAEALGMGAEMPALETPTTPEDFRARVAELYDQMRAALQRGDLAGFALSYESLGVLLGRAPR